VFGYYIITREYFKRYRLPVMHTETNNLGHVESVKWLRNMWLNMLKLKEDGVPLLGFTWYGLLDQVDWDTALREDNGTVNALGLYDLNRNMRLAGKAYARLVRQWRNVLPMLSRRLDLEDGPDGHPIEEPVSQPRNTP
jgi:beta-glucosidase/6-phospho-beta-glucosidase/beta-galactosidase